MTATNQTNSNPYEIIEALSGLHDDTLASVIRALANYPALLAPLMSEQTDEGQRKKIHELGMNIWNQCKEDIKKRQTTLDSSFWNIKDCSSTNELASIAKFDQEFQNCLEKVKQFLTSNIARQSIPSVKNEQYTVNLLYSGKKQELQVLYHLNQILQQIMKENQTFAKEWGALDIEQRNKILNLSSNDYKKIDKQSLDAVIKTYLIHSIEWLALSKVGISNFFSKWARLYFELCEKGSPERVLKLIQDAQKYSEALIDNKSKKMEEFIRLLQNYPTELETVEKRLPILKKLCADPRAKFPETRLSSIMPFHLTIYLDTALQIYQRCPSIYIRLMSDKYGYVLPRVIGKLIEQVSENELILFLDLFETLPDVLPSIETLLQSSPQTIKSLFPVCQWFAGEIKKDSSKQRLEQLGLLLDKMAALQKDQPLLMEKLLKIPPNKIALWELILKDVEYTSSLTVEQIKVTLKGNNEETISQQLFDIWQDTDLLNATCEQFLKTNPELKDQFIAWLNRILSLNDQPLEASNALKSALIKLPENTRKLIWRITTFEDKNKKSIKEVLKFAQEFPYNGPVEKFFEICTPLFHNNSENVVKQLQAFYELVKNTPSLLPRYIVILKQTPDQLIGLLNLSKQVEPVIFKYIVQQYVANKHQPQIEGISIPHSTLYWKPLEELLKSPHLLKNFVELMKFEITTSITLFPTIAIVLEHIKAPLFSFLISSKDIAKQFAWNEWTARQLEILEARLKEDPKHLERLFAIAAKYPKTLQLFLEETALGNTNINKSLISTFYAHLALLYNDPRKREICDRLLWIYEQGEKDLVYFELIPFIGQNLQLLSKLLDMARGGSLSEVKRLLTLKKQSPNDLLTHKLLDLACSQNSALIRRVQELQMRKKHPGLLKLLANEPLGKPVSELLQNLLVLYCRGDDELLNTLMVIANKPADKSTPCDKNVLALVAGGHFHVAQEAILNENDPVWKTKITMQPALQQSLRNFDINLILQDSSKMKRPLTESAKNSLRDFAFALARQKGQEQRAKEWIGKVEFLLSHDPQMLERMTSTTIWKEALQGIAKQEDSTSLIEQTMKQLPLDITALLDSFLKAYIPAESPASAPNQLITKITLALANCLVTFSGNINTFIIDSLRSTPTYTTLSVNSYYKRYLDRTLEALKHHEFSERLEDLVAPDPRSHQAELIRSQLELPPKQEISARDVQMIALSALLWPLGQSNVGSCFGTSVAIQLDSSNEGQLQSLEDYIDLLSNGSLVRSTPDLQGSIEYPMTYERGIFSDKFKGDHYLARGREYTIASMAVGGSDLRIKAIEKWTSILNISTNKFKSNLSTEPEKEEFGKIEKAIQESIKSNLNYYCQVLYLGFAHHPEADFDGAWKLIDRETGKPLGSSLTDLHNFFKKVLEKVHEQLSKQYPLQTKMLKTVQGSLLAHITSKNFLESFFDGIQMLGIKNKGLSGINPSKYCHLLVNSPLVKYEGGSPQHALEAYHGQKIVSAKLLANLHPLEAIEEHYLGLSQAEKSAAESNTESLRSVSIGSHAFNLKLGKIVQMKNVKTLVHGLKMRNADFLNTPITTKPLKQIVNIYADYLSEELQTPFKITLENMLKTKPCKNLRELCDLIVEISCAMTGDQSELERAQRILLWSINRIPRLKEKFDFNYSVFDLNWTGGISVSYGLALDRHGMMDSLTRHNGEDYQAHWSPGPISQGTVFEYPNIAQRFSRAYYRHKK